MEPPISLDKCLLVLLLRTLNCTQDEVASMVRIAKTAVGNIEKWIQSVPFAEAAVICNDQTIKRIVGRELTNLEEVSDDLLVRAGQVTSDDILRRCRSDYLEQRVQAIPYKYFEKHWDDLANAAFKLTRNLRSLLPYEEERFRTIRMEGNVIDGGRVVQRRAALTSCYEEVLQHEYMPEKLNEMITRALCSHLGLDINELRKLTIVNITKDIVDKVEIAVYKRTFEGTTCDICKDW